MRNNTTDNSGAAYNIGRATVTRTGTTANVAQNDSTSGWNLGEVDSLVPDEFFFVNIDMRSPFSALSTAINYTGHYINTATSFVGSAGGGVHNPRTSYNGVNLIASTGTITGTIRTYGWTN